MMGQGHTAVPALTPPKDLSAGVDDPKGPLRTPPPSPGRRGDSPFRSIVKLATAVRDADPAEVEAQVVQLSGTRRWLTPLGYVAGTLALIVAGIKPLFKNWRLTLIELVPAAWVWFSMWNLKSHVLDGRSVHHFHGYVEALGFLLMVAAATIAFYCNAIFAFSISGEQPPRIGPAARQAATHMKAISLWGLGFGTAHAVVSFVVAPLGKPWYSLSLLVVLAAMLVSFVAVPAALAGLKEQRTSSQKVGYAAVGGALAAVAATPGFIFDRAGLLLMGVPSLRIVGFALLSIGVALQIAGTSGVKSVKLSARFNAAAP